MRTNENGARGISFLLSWSILAVAPLLLTLGACSSREETAARAFAQAEASFEMGDLATAKRSVVAANLARDDVAAQWLLLGRISLAARDAPAAYFAYQRVLELDSANPEALQLVAEIALQIGRPRDALRAADQLLSVQVGAPAALLVKGLIALDEGKIDEAEAFSRTILERDPANEGSAILGARARARRGDLAGAAALLEGLPTAQTSEAILANIVEVRRKQGNAALLIRTLEKLVELSPREERVIDLAGILYRQGQQKAARKIILELLGNNASDDAAHGRIAGFLAANDPSIFADPQAFEAARSGSPLFHMTAARLLFQAGDVARTSALLGDPRLAGNADARALRAAVDYARGRSAEAARERDAVLKLDERNSEALKLRARMRADEGDYRGALADAQIVIGDNPRTAVPRLLAAQINERRGNELAARTVYLDALRAMPDDVTIARAYTRALKRGGQAAVAERVARDFTQLNPASVSGWALLGELCIDEICRATAKAGMAAARENFSRPKSDMRPRGGLFGDL